MARSAVRPQISNRAARAIFLQRHGLAGQQPWQSSQAKLIDLIESLGFVQLDSIRTVERAHHMILSARSNRYRPAHLRRLLERDRAVFEHWTHDAALIAARFYPHWQLRFERDRERLASRWRKWRRDGFEQRFDDVLRHIADHGPVSSRTIGKDEARPSGGGWWDWHPSKTALEYLWRTGQLAVCRRDGFEKVFDLTERVIPQQLCAERPSETETVDWACRTALERLGFATSGEIAAFWDTVRPDEAKAWCQTNLGKALIEIEIEAPHGGRPRTSHAMPSILEEIEVTAEVADRLRILSPFDPVLRDRKRAERLFDFHYRIEVFVPAERRQYGYYVFPILEKDRIIARIDMKRTEDGECLHVTALWPERGVAMGKRRTGRLDGELHRVARFIGCERVTYAHGWLRLSA